MPAGSITFLPKIHRPVSTTMKLPPTSWVASSTLPIFPSRASTLNPFKSMFGGVATAKVHVSMVAIPTSLRGYASLGFPTLDSTLAYPRGRPRNSPARWLRDAHFCSRNETASPNLTGGFGPLCQGTSHHRDLGRGGRDG